VDDMLECRQAGIDEVNKMFGTNISVELSSAWSDNQFEKDLMQEQMESEISDKSETEGGDDIESEESISEDDIE
jgi:hypothetical protein